MVATTGAGWRLAPSLLELYTQTNARWPTRSQLSDGSIGDARHQQTKSDHNPAGGWVCALDITEDARHGPDLMALWHHLVATRDGRVKYLIYERRIVSSYSAGGVAAWVARPYAGLNAHDRHLHVSVRDIFAKGPWYPVAGPAPKIPERPYPGSVRMGDRGDAVRAWQRALTERGYDIAADGIYGPATHHVVLDWQARHGLIPDGIAGKRTWHTLLYA